MQLSDWEARANVGRQSCVDRLPDDIRDQLVKARTTGSHSAAAMVAWLKHEGYDEVTTAALYNWFQTRGINRVDAG